MYAIFELNVSPHSPVLKMANLRILIVWCILAFVKYGQGDETCSNGGICTGDKECCHSGTRCCEKFWTTTRIILIAGALIVALVLLIALIVAGVYYGCYKKKNNVIPMQQQPGGSGYNQPPPPYEYNINDRDAAFIHPPPLPAYSKGIRPGEKKINVKAFNEDD